MKLFKILGHVHWLIISFFGIISCSKTNDFTVLYYNEYKPTKIIGLEPMSVIFTAKNDTINIGDTLKLHCKIPKRLFEFYINRNIELTDVQLFIKFDSVTCNDPTEFEFGVPLSINPYLYKYWKTVIHTGSKKENSLYQMEVNGDSLLLEIKYIALQRGVYHVRTEVQELSAHYYQPDTLINFIPKFECKTQISSSTSLDHVCGKLVENYIKAQYYFIYVQ